LVDRALLVWEPSSTLSNAKSIFLGNYFVIKLFYVTRILINAILVDEYVQLAKEKYGYNSEQALGMLFWHRHDMEKALAVSWPSRTAFQMLFAFL